ncbi:Octanoate-[acyl-carrier-protein]-protein-N-octano yltransferase [Planctomycetales bacterium 10988]|nr:Octanoate-[acyl-carrier-protein]-protein-N-octano yltransferase [Planctomycetales bacterium 10988]
MAKSSQSTSGVSLEAFLMGTVDFDACLALQQRLVYELSGRDDGQVALLLCEHPPLITIGRAGSWQHVHLNQRERTSRGLAVRWVNRGGPAILHAPGQLAVYPIFPLDWHEIAIGTFLERFRSGMQEVLSELGIQSTTRPGSFDLFGRTGQLAMTGVAVKNWTTYYGMYLNVRPPSHLLSVVSSDPEENQATSTLHRERRLPLSMTRVREAVVRHLATSFGCQRFHVYSGHPLFPSVLHANSHSQTAARVG